MKFANVTLFHTADAEPLFTLLPPPQGIPNTWDWWITHVVALVVMVVLGEYLCSRRELQDIPLVPLP